MFTRTSMKPQGMRQAAGVAALAALVVTSATGCSSDSTDSANSSTTTSVASSQTENAPAGATSAAGGAAAADANADLRTQKLRVTADSAVATGKRLGNNGTMHAVELDYSDDARAWQWTVKTLDGSTDHKVVINAATGQVVEHKQSATNDHEQAVDLKQPVTYDEALKLATAKVNGPLHSWKLEWDNGRRAYQFDLGQTGKTQEVTVEVPSKQVRVD